MGIIVFFLAIIAAYVGEVINTNIGFPGTGAIFAIATVGGIITSILWSDRKKQNSPEERKNDSGEQGQQGELDFANEQDIEESEASNDQEG